ncbi:FMN-dependent NADH-azoreductase [Hydrocarboniphaga effusa]|jgi:FMN-dependent NADH-azoreductase|uniref:FMN-dependent NADH-azoreductase n=1 Tax=Hydrocarboniphaga effusa TaxID=243629 RepID=UPI0035B40C7F
MTTTTEPTLLQINTSLFAESGNSSALSERFVSEWRKRHPNGRVIVRDLSRNPVPHLDGARAAALFTPAEQRTPEQNAVVAESDALIAELKSADVIVLGLPMYNFGVPSQLKSYLDHVARAGVTFRYTANGPEGLIGDRKLYVMAARGGIYKDLPADTQTGFVRTFFNFIGIRDVEFVYAEGLNLDAASKTRALEAAGEQIDRLAA